MIIINHNCIDAKSQTDMFGIEMLNFYGFFYSSRKTEVIWMQLETKKKSRRQIVDWKKIYKLEIQRKKKIITEFCCCNYWDFAHPIFLLTIHLKWSKEICRYKLFCFTRIIPLWHLSTDFIKIVFKYLLCVVYCIAYIFKITQIALIFIFIYYKWRMFTCKCFDLTWIFAYVQICSY